MDVETIRKMLDNPNVSDDEFFEALKEFLNGFDGTMDEISELSRQTQEKRPNVMDMLTKHIIEGHKGCCGPKAKNER